MKRSTIWLVRLVYSLCVSGCCYRVELKAIEGLSLTVERSSCDMGLPALQAQGQPDHDHEEDDLPRVVHAQLEDIATIHVRAWEPEPIRPENPTGAERWAYLLALREHRAKYADRRRRIAAARRAARRKSGASGNELTDPSPDE